MPIFVELARHSPENCPHHNEKVRKVFMDTGSMLEGLLKKHGIKMIGSCVVHQEHLHVYMFDAPSFEALQKFSAEPEVQKIFDYQTSEIKPGVSLEEALKTVYAAQKEK